MCSFMKNMHLKNLLQPFIVSKPLISCATVPRYKLHNITKQTMLFVIIILFLPFVLFLKKKQWSIKFIYVIVHNFIVGAFEMGYMQLNKDYTFLEFL